jgi:hypothetical protein
MSIVFEPNPCTAGENLRVTAFDQQNDIVHVHLELAGGASGTSDTDGDTTSISTGTDASGTWVSVQARATFRNRFGKETNESGNVALKKKQIDD